MPIVRFTDNIQRHVPCPEATVAGDTVHQSLSMYFDQQPRARHYVLDDQGRLRKHIALFVNGAHIQDRDRLSDPVAADDCIDVFQALSGG